MVCMNMSRSFSIVLCPLFLKTTSFDPLIPLCIVSAHPGVT